MRRVICWFLTASAGLFFFPAAGPAATQDFYQGKVIRIVVGFSPGGAFDAYSCSLSRHMRKYLPGNPTITSAPIDASATRDRIRFSRSE